MADNIMLDQGTSGVYAETDEITTGVHRQVMQLGGIGACRLKKLGTASRVVVCTTANTDVTSGAALASTTKYLTVYCSYPCIVAMGEATSYSATAANVTGVYVAAGIPTTFPVTYTGVTADDTPHVQSPTAGAIVRLTQMAD